jgi:hypothetical protein
MLTMRFQKTTLLVSVLILTIYSIAFTLGDHEFIFYFLVALQIAGLAGVFLNFKNQYRKPLTYIIILASLLIILACIYVIVVNHFLLVGKGPI